jgi:hypothetical protein
VVWGGDAGRVLPFDIDDLGPWSDEPLSVTMKPMEQANR